eukprot:GILI01004822.1.p1 GENE.GILI01004822.1~~GILI01004822.1.p1  ORF type:complete len:553 (-),score=129.90 GILI01004822.1:499-2157(-)
MPPVPFHKKATTAPPRMGATLSNHRAATHRRNHQRDIGMLMLLLAAETVASVAHPQQVMATEMLAAAFHHLGDNGHHHHSSANPPSSFTSQHATKLLTPQAAAESLDGETESSDESEVPEDHGVATPTHGSSFGWVIGDVPASNTPKRMHDSATVANSSLLERSVMQLSDSAATTRTSSRGTAAAASRTDTPVVNKASSSVVFANNIIVNTVVSFLSWREAVSVRGVSKLWMQSTLNIVSVCRMPLSGTPALFIPYPAQEAIAPHRPFHMNHHNTTPEPLYWSSQTAAWMCPNCCATNSPARSSCSRYGCGAVSPYSWDSQRLFFGQLRRDGTIPFVLWALRDVAGISEREIRTIENHRDKVTGRGKGCAWVTVSSHPAANTDISTDGPFSLANAPSAADKLLSLHHRAFFDTIHGVEGLWLTIPSTAGDLDKEASMRGNNGNQQEGFRPKSHYQQEPMVSSHPSIPQHHPRHMPRSSVVVEATNPTHSTLTANHFLGRSRNFPIHYIRSVESGKIRYVHNPYFQMAPVPQPSMAAPQLVSNAAAEAVSEAI